MDLKAETVGLGVALELPLVVIDIQRAGPSTGMPTKTEQADLLQAMYGRHTDTPVPIVAPRTPSDCFFTVIEAVRIAIKYRTPVFVLSDAYLANGAEPWQVPDVESLPDISVQFATETNATDSDGQPSFLPYIRDPDTMARPWAIPGTAGLEHRIGGLEKGDNTGNVSYDPENHEHMVRLRAAKVANIARDIPPVEVDDPSGDAEILVLGWGSTYGAIVTAVRRLRAKGRKVAQAHLLHLNPFPTNLSEVLHGYPAVVVPEGNLGQLVKLVRAEFLVDAKSVTKIQGQPFTARELEQAIEAHLATNGAATGRKEAVQ
jgi:2-oxoglutarate ferredoxin oxidoreductase subunit alpha